MMSWTWDREKEGDYDDHVVKGWNTPITFDQLQYIRIYWKQQNDKWVYEFLFHGTMKKLHPRYYFRQQEFIKGTYIRKDKFRENLKYEVHYINPIINIPDDKDYIRKLREVAREIGFIPIRNTKNISWQEQRNLN